MTEQRPIPTNENSGLSAVRTALVAGDDDALALLFGIERGPMGWAKKARRAAVCVVRATDGATEVEREDAADWLAAHGLRIPVEEAVDVQ